MNEISAAVVLPEVEVTEKAVRRQFSAEYKRKILREADACTREGEIGPPWPSSPQTRVSCSSKG